MGFTGRSEAEVFADLVTLTAQPGYVYAIAQICCRDSMVSYEGEYTASDLSHLYDSNRLIRTEIVTLLGLMVRNPLDMSFPGDSHVQAYVSRSYELMDELHNAMSSSMFDLANQDAAKGVAPEKFWNGATLREPMFYGPESAFSFQYRDFFIDRHSCDDEWLRKHKGFDSQQAKQVAQKMCSMMDSRATRLLTAGGQIKASADVILQQFEFTPEDVSQRTGLTLSVVKAVFDALTFTGQNALFHELGDFNSVAATPLLPTGRGSVLLFSQYAIYEALYESPFFWMNGDADYKQRASDHRGAFVERFAHKRLAAVFGGARVYTNVNLFQGKDVAAEADVLVVFGDRMIIVQAKAKKLTLAARKGNEGQIAKDFAEAIQKAADQGKDCADVILSGKCKMFDDKGHEIEMPKSIKEIFRVCLVPDHYPALALQASEFLKYQTTDVIQAPLVMDVFLLDVLAEMLDSPLRFLSYVRLRVTAQDKLMVSHELTTLGYHLRQNLWLDSQFDLAYLDDSFASDLEVAMSARRDGLPGQLTPPGILTQMQGTLYERLIAQVERNPSPATLELGFDLLTLSGESCRRLHEGLSAITAMAKRDGQLHDFTLMLEDEKSGVTFQCDPDPKPSSTERLQAYCEARKYASRANNWFGVSISPDVQILCAMASNKPWVQSDGMDEVAKTMRKPAGVSATLKTLERSMRVGTPGRNDRCLCGSGKKFKKCCLPSASGSAPVAGKLA
ncbi:SEC-C metal-binding domain-containing protein [Pseudomonas sp. URMO17WK12:I11]|uniref:SEC-C metal-binding domain-containing protein n=1 Tax=Pseudomonas sp. URMO17WK12:I11 TaxID=1283291 RepID=UPI0018D75AFB|nr:SEC-C metal-binding domain-containing protein [Pseudomonas sp. URMO17WK12:I11]MBH3362909.1 SEC-C domain-containing protein [Pseudomonas sp. URMO17WK12:I11]